MSKGRSLLRGLVAMRVQIYEHRRRQQTARGEDVPPHLGPFAILCFTFTALCSIFVRIPTMYTMLNWGKHDVNPNTKIMLVQRSKYIQQDSPEPP